MEDREIVKLYLRRDEQAIQESERKYSRYLRSIAGSILSDAEDTAECENDAYLAAWNSIPPQEPADLKTYLGKLTRRISIDRYRKRTAGKRGGGEYALSLDELEECVPSAADSPENVLEGAALSGILDAFLRTLPETKRIIFLRRYWYAEPVADIAARFGYKENRVRTMLFRIREELKEHLSKEGIWV